MVFFKLRWKHSVPDDSNKFNIMTVPEKELDAETVPDAGYYKEQAIECIQRGELKGAVLLLTTALNINFSQKSQPPDVDLLCLRSRVYIKLDMLYLAYEDAEKAVIFRPNSPDGFICHGEIYLKAGCYEMALMFFGLAAELNPMMEVTDELLSLVKRASVLGKRSRMITKRIPWVGAGVGIILGVSIVLADQLLTNSPFVAHPALMVILVIVISLAGYGLARGYLYWRKMQIAKRLSPPRQTQKMARVEDKKEDLSSSGTTGDDLNGSINGEAAKNRIRYSKAQARQRFKKGKF